MVVGMQHQQQEPHASPATVLEDATTPCSVSTTMTIPLLPSKLPDKMDCCNVIDDECSLTTTTTTETKDLPGTVISNNVLRNSSSKITKTCAQIAYGSRAKLKEVNEHLICILCDGYFVDATTIAECLHSFCRSCLILYLAAKNLCPKCGIEVNGSKPDTHLKPDHQLQDIVYKLVPGLFHAEMKRRNLFYQDKPDRDADLLPEYRGVTVDGLVYSLEDNISFSLEYYDTLKEKEDWENKGAHRVPFRTGQINNIDSDGDEGTLKRYFKCPAAVRVINLKKLIIQKYNLRPNHKVELIHKRESLPDDYSLMDLAYIYAWKRNSPLPLYFRINIATSIAKSIQKKSQQVLKVAAQSSQPSSIKIIVPCETDDMKINCAEEKVKSDLNCIKSEPDHLDKPQKAKNISADNTSIVGIESKLTDKTSNKMSSLLVSTAALLTNKSEPAMSNVTITSAAKPIAHISTEKLKSTNSTSAQDHTKKLKPVKTLIPSSNTAISNADLSSTTTTQSSPIKSYLTISSINKSDPDLKLAASVKNTVVRSSKDDASRKVAVTDSVSSASPVVIKITRVATTNSSNVTVVSSSTPVMSTSELNKKLATSKSFSKLKDKDRLSSAPVVMTIPGSMGIVAKEALQPSKTVPSATNLPVSSSIRTSSSNTQNSASISPPPLITLTTTVHTMTNTSSTVTKNSAYLLPNTKIPSSLEISVAQAKDSTIKTSSASVLSLHRVISTPKQSNPATNKTDVLQPILNGQTKQTEIAVKTFGVKRRLDNNCEQTAEKYPVLSISKTTLTSPADELKPSEVLMSTSEKPSSNKTIFSPNMPNILPEVSITLNPHPEPPSKRLMLETSYDVSCFKPIENVKKDSTCNGIPPLTPIIKSSTNIQNSPIKNLNKFIQSNSHPPLLSKNQSVTNNQSRANLNKSVAIKRSSGTSGSVPIKRATIENSESLSLTNTNGFSQIESTLKSNLSAKKGNERNTISLAAKSNGQITDSVKPGKKDSVVGRHLSMPKLIDIHTSQYFQLKAAQSAKWQASQQLANTSSNNSVTTSLYVTPPPLGEGNNDALDLSPTSNSPTIGNNLESPLQQHQQQQIIEKKKVISMVPHLISKGVQNIGKDPNCKSSPTVLPPKIERKVSSIMKSVDKKTSPSSLYNRKTEFKSSNLSPLKTSPNENCKSPSISSASITFPTSAKLLTSTPLMGGNMTGWPVPVPFHPAMIPVPFYGMPSWLNSYQGPLPGHPLMGDRVNNLPTSTHQVMH